MRAQIEHDQAPLLRQPAQVADIGPPGRQTGGSPWPSSCRARVVPSPAVKVVVVMADKPG
ncbi:hypothetical protein ACIBKY_01375 [Nonomuraea sp. NPDC050394]|uniref:hypothetical protein n=1 Tax=Nonomuraea sp. NPDC050394 TaxID=3364363 RepID=UPI0037AD7BBC